MKKVFLATLLVVSLTTFAQEERKAGSKRAEMEKMTPEQRGELRLKRVSAMLNLTEKQQKEIAPILAEQQQKREKAVADFKAAKEKGAKPTAEERAARAKQREDDQKALASKLQKILTPEQMKKWEEMKERNKERIMEKKAAMQKE
jgi:Spy/CpxP family protein refolding chaperone